MQKLVGKFCFTVKGLKIGVTSLHWHIRSVITFHKTYNEE